MHGVETKADGAVRAGEADGMHELEETADGAAKAAKSSGVKGLRGEANLEVAALIFPRKNMDDIFYRVGGRIWEAFDYARAPTLWKAEQKATIDGTFKEEAILSLVDTKGNADAKSLDRIRTMFRH